MKVKAVDRIIIVITLVAIMLTTAVGVSATTYNSTLSLSAGSAFWGSARSYEGNGNLQIKFTGSGSNGNNGTNVIEPYERILGFDYACGYKNVGTSVNETWTNCPSGTYKFYFGNNGTTTWSSSNVTMKSW